MTLTFVVIGLVCNSLGCYWAQEDSLGEFPDQQSCYARAANFKGKSAGDFDTACMVAPQAWDSAIEEAGAYIDSMANDGRDTMQTLMEQVVGLMNGSYVLQETPRGPIGVVQS